MATGVGDGLVTGLGLAIFVLGWLLLRHPHRLLGAVLTPSSSTAGDPDGVPAFMVRACRVLGALLIGIALIVLFSIVVQAVHPSSLTVIFLEVL